MMKPARSKPERLADVVDRGQRIANLLADPVVQEFLDHLESDALELLMSSARNVGTTTDAVRAASAIYTAIRDMKHMLRSAAADGVRVMKNMSEI